MNSKHFQDPPDEDFDEMADQGNWQTASESVDNSSTTLTIANTETGAFGWEPEE